jgi:hypothetical protein
VPVLPRACPRIRPVFCAIPHVSHAGIYGGSSRVIDDSRDLIDDSRDLIDHSIHLNVDTDFFIDEVDPPQRSPGFLHRCSRSTSTLTRISSSMQSIHLNVDTDFFIDAVDPPQR